MSRVQNVFIVTLAVIISVVLFAQGEKYNVENSDYGLLVQECRALRFDYGSCVARRAGEIVKEYGAPSGELESRKELQMTFLVIPSVVFIVALFVSFSASENEKHLTLIALTPLFLSFLQYYPYAPQKWMIPMYLLFASIITWFISQLKRTLKFVH
jgi:hypothetical protein